MKRKITFHIGSDKDSAILHEKLGEYFKCENYSISFICDSKVNYEYLKSKFDEVFDVTVNDSREFSFEEKDEIIKYVKKGEFIDISEIYSTEYSFYSHNPVKQEKIINRAFCRVFTIKEIIDRGFKTDYIFDFSGDEISHTAMKLLANILRATRISYRESIFPDRISFNINQFGLWQIPNTRQNSNIKREEIIYINNFIKEYFVNKKVFWGDPKQRDYKFKFNYKRVLYSRKINKNLKEIYFDQIYKFKRIYYKKISNILYDRLEDINNKKYFYFPLHYPIDSQLVYRGKPFKDQISFIKLLVTYLPHDHYLVVKEHPHARGAISYKDLKSIKEYKNIKLLHPWVNSHNVLKMCKAVLVINSTVALEALYHGIPVVSFGKNYYVGHNIVNEIKEFYELNKVFDERNYIKVDRDKFTYFLVNAFRHSYPINPIKMLNAKLDGSEIKELAKAIIHFINNQIPLLKEKI